MREMRRKDRQITDPEKIRDIILDSQCCRLGFYDDGEVYIKKLWINNSKLQQNISSNENNYITILVKNDSTIDKAGRMILALYDTNNMFTGAIQKDVILDALTSTRIETDDVIIPESVAYGKLFMWECDTMYPLTNVFLFE